MVERVAAFVDTLVHRTRPSGAPVSEAPRDVHRVPLLRQVRLADLRALLRVLAGWPQASPAGVVPRGVALGRAWR